MPKILIGKLVSKKTPKTAIVEVDSSRPHPLYKKMVRKTKRYKVLWENQEAEIGDRVKIAETRPMSATKHFKLVEVLKKG
ncbi:30S ribosomal protein S17 [Candidatus Microgenomates bacterium]|nr:30S ribosomal protein S17 [Candidatus Microgenomates bacterium]